MQVRLAADVAENVTKAAMTNNRSVPKEVNHRLQRSFDVEWIKHEAETLRTPGVALSYHPAPSA